MMRDHRAVHQERIEWLREVAAREPTGRCIDWPWRTGPKGYPPIMALAGARDVLTSHVLMEILGRPRPSPEHGVLHSCDRPPCLAPWHLRWGTLQENVDDMVQRARHVRGEKHPRAKLTEEAVREIRAAVAAGASHRSQARAYGVGHAAIGRIIHGRRWAHVSD